MTNIRSLIPKLMILLAAGSLLTVAACKQASFTATPNTERQTPPQPDVPGGQDNGGLVPNTGDGGSSTQAPCGAGVNCNDTPWLQTPSAPPFSPDLPGPPVVTEYPQNPNFPGVRCLQNNYTNTSRNFNVQAVDLWMVVDASESFDAERVAIGEAIVDGFLQATNLGVPVNVSVIIAHTPDSPYHPARAPNIFYQHSNEPATIVLTPGMSGAQMNAAKNNLLIKLQANMRKDPNALANPSGLHSGAGELGLLALQYAMLRAPRNANNALAILFMSDENDACMITYNDNQDERDVYDRYCVPAGTSPASVYSAIRNFAQARPTVVNSVVYTGWRQIPSGIQNGKGWGYLDVTSLAGGQAFELAPTPGVSYEAYLQTLARDTVNVTASMTSQNSQYYPYYPVYDAAGRRIDFDQIRIYNGNTLDLRVSVDGTPVAYSIDKSYNLITPSRSGSQVTIEYCLR